MQLKENFASSAAPEKPASILLQSTRVSTSDVGLNDGSYEGATNTFV
jgi:hypothetical protein